MAGEANDLIDRVVAGGARATRIVADDLLGEAVQRAPVEEGTLRASGHVVYIVNGLEFPADQFAQAVEAAQAHAKAGTLTEFRGEVRFSTVYAAAQHEGIALMTRGQTAWVWQAQNYPRGGGPKFLEHPLMEKAPRYEAALKRSIDPQIGGGR